MESSTMKGAYSEIQRLSEDAETGKAAIAREIHLRDQIQWELDARDEGKEEGKEESKIEVILNLHRKQYPIEAIAEVVNMPIEDVLGIVKSNIQ